MNLLNSNSTVIPKATPNLELTTHLAIGAHPDDNEFMAYNGIGECYGKKDERFTGVVITDGAGSTRNGIYRDMSLEEISIVRRVELMRAANFGDFLALVYLGYTSPELKGSRQNDIRQDIVEVLINTRPEVVYVHNLFDDHDTHVAASRLSIDALREVRDSFVPQRVYGCEMTGSLDWYPARVRLDTSMHERVAHQVLHVFESQSDNLRSYPEATIARWISQAVYDRENKRGPHKISFAMDLTALVNDGTDMRDFIAQITEQFRQHKLRLFDGV